MKQPHELTYNDTFWIKYGFSYVRFRVWKVYDDGVLAHAFSWCRGSSMIFSFEELKTMGYHYHGKISRFRSFFLL